MSSFPLRGGISENLIGIGPGIRSGLAVTGGGYGGALAFIIDRYPLAKMYRKTWPLSALC